MNDIKFIQQNEETKRQKNKRNNKQFYNSKNWKLTREIKINETPVCEHCNCCFASHVHHKKELDEFPELGLVLDNLESLCISCHSKHHANSEDTKTIPTWNR